MELVLPVSKVHFDLTSVLSTLAQNAVLVETPGVTRCLLSDATSKTGEKQMVLNTEGINMHEMFNHSDVRTLTPRLPACVSSVGDFDEDQPRQIQALVLRVVTSKVVSIQYKH